MGRIVFMFVGVILMVTGLIISQSSASVTIQGQRADAETANTVRYAVGGGIGGLGALFTLAGAISMVRASRQKKRNLHLMQTGVAAEGTVTFVDKNYTMLVNNTPIYSIVEYTYRDRAGTEHTRKVTEVPSEIVIRKQIQVGGKVAIKYSAEQPAESVLLLT